MNVPHPRFFEHRRKLTQLLCFISILLPLTEPAWADLPPGWSDADIGSPGLAGSAAYTNGNWTVTGGGADVWNAACEGLLHFLDRQGRHVVFLFSAYENPAH